MTKRNCQLNGYITVGKHACKSYLKEYAHQLNNDTTVNLGKTAAVYAKASSVRSLSDQDKPSSHQHNPKATCSIWEKMDQCPECVHFLPTD
eukprot:scaffold108538_cov24-Prasinocladus_malaysianus.AAC.1